MDQLSKDNSFSSDDIKSFKDEFTLLKAIEAPEGQNQTLSGIVFESLSGTVRYNILYNGTSNWDLYDGNIDEPFVIPELQTAIDNAICNLISLNF